MSRRWLQSLALSSVCIVGLFAARDARADILTLALANPIQSSSGLSSTTFTATVTAPLSNTGIINLNGADFTADSGLTVDLSGFNDFPFTLSPGDMFTGTLFSVSLPSGATQNSYGGTVFLLGGVSGDSQDSLASADFTLRTGASTSVTPEPSSALLVSTGILSLLVLMGMSKHRSGNLQH